MGCLAKYNYILYKNLITRNFNSTLQNAENKIIVEKLSSITKIGINRPEKRNSLDIETLEQLSNEIVAFENDPNANIAILYGIGGNFCAGYDLQEIGKSEEVAKEFLNKVISINLTNRFIKKPLIAAISGYAVGSGLELALMCDLRVIEVDAVMGFLNRRFGVPTLDGGISRLKYMVGFSFASDLLLTGRGINADEAFKRGLAARLVASGTALGQSINLASSLLKYPQECLNADRKALYYSTFGTGHLEDVTNFQKKLLNNEIFEESVIGANKFLSGIGRHGKFYNIQEIKKKHWEYE